MVNALDSRAGQAMDWHLTQGRGRGRRNTPTRLHTTLGMSAGPFSRFARMQTLPYLDRIVILELEFRIFDQKSRINFPFKSSLLAIMFCFTIRILALVFYECM